MSGTSWYNTPTSVEKGTCRATGGKCIPDKWEPITRVAGMAQCKDCYRKWLIRRPDIQPEWRHR